MSQVSTDVLFSSGISGVKVADKWIAYDGNNPVIIKTNTKFISIGEKSYYFDQSIGELIVDINKLNFAQRLSSTK